MCVLTDEMSSDKFCTVSKENDILPQYIWGKQNLKKGKTAVKTLKYETPPD